MNNYEKEVMQSLLDDEEDVIAELRKQYQRALDDIGEKIRILQSDDLTESKIYQIEYQKALKGQIEGILTKMTGDSYSTISQYLNGCYTNGFIGTMFDMHGQGVPLLLPIDQNALIKAVLTDSKISSGLYDALGVDANRLKKTIASEITRGLAAGQQYSDIARSINSIAGTGFSNAKRIVRTEGHRIQQAATYDAQQASKAKGADVFKQWDATLDGLTRENHRLLDGQLQEVDDPFEISGKKAMYPGDFGDPSEDCNCRCVSLTRPRWALDDEELQTLKDRAAFFGLDMKQQSGNSKAFGQAKGKQFAEFKNKYQNATKILENTEKSGIIKAGRFNKKGDPMYDVTGRAIDTNPDGINDILEDLKSSNAEVIYRAGAMAYSPSLSPGKAGQFIIDDESSYSAWLHEYKHFCDDRDDGFLGMRVFADPEKCKQREINAYQVEIEIAKSFGRDDVVKQLEELLNKEISKYE